MKKPMRKVLLVYPEFPVSFWGFQHAIEFIGKKSNVPPLGLLTIAGMLPEESYEIKLIDMNVTSLRDEHITWADLVLASSMIAQQKSLKLVIAQCNLLGVPIVVGGPHATSYHVDIEGVDHFILGEGEEIFPEFLVDFENGEAGKIYRAPGLPDMSKTVPPRFDLLDLGAYRSMALQFSRGCPFDCEFCEITNLFGKVPRTKTNEQMLTELEIIYDIGWRGPVFLADDNLIGNRRNALNLLNAIAEWQKEKGYPFSFYTEASMTLAELEPLMDSMVEARLTTVFLGIESPNPDTLKKMHKNQNTKKNVDNYMQHAVKTIQSKGIMVSGGFIVGLDGDGPEIFDTQINFIKDTGIAIAIVGLLTVVRGTNLYERLEREGRLIRESICDSMDVNINFIPELDKQKLLNGYRHVLNELYDPTLSNYFKRCLSQFRNMKSVKHNNIRIGKTEVIAIMISFKRQILSKQGYAYLKFILKTIFQYPKMLTNAFEMAIVGYHLQKHAEQILLSYKDLPDNQ